MSEPASLPGTPPVPPSAPTAPTAHFYFTGTVTITRPVACFARTEAEAHEQVGALIAQSASDDWTVTELAIRATPLAVS